MRQLVQHRVASRGIKPIYPSADVWVILVGDLAAPAFRGGVVVAVRWAGGCIAGVVEEVFGRGRGPEQRAYFNYLLIRGTSRSGIRDEDAVGCAGWRVFTLKLDGIIVVRASDTFHHNLEVGELRVDLSAAEVVRETLIIGGDVLGLVGKCDGVAVGFFEDTLHGGKAGARVVGAPGRRGVVAVVGEFDLPSSFGETIVAAG